MLNVDDETGHMEPRSAAGVRGVTAAGADAVAEVGTAAGGRSRRVAYGASVRRVAHNGGVHIGSAYHGSAYHGRARIGGARIGIARNGDALNGDAHSRIARDGVPHADVLDGTRHDTDGPEHRTSGPERRTSGPECRTAGPEARTAALTSAPTIRPGQGAANAGRPTEAGR
ncbi:hypothetical protein [Streptomyces phaeochromogenes]|uniref:hypothetical protein n=1 Tax=Streptomyces phaeochromogenes TaxID=1923 RepID=UPI002DD822E5|nr:hypothetical protein [Streptomyces phaeochromogenes]WRZ28607.1 hypothetical protein OG931_12990 [Streptomyces phaeochromogenes]